MSLCVRVCICRNKDIYICVCVCALASFLLGGWVFLFCSAAAAVPEGLQYTQPCLFVRGEHSHYVQGPQREEAVRKLFPRAEIVTVEGAGHWVHAEQPEKFTAVVNDFLERHHL